MDTVKSFYEPKISSLENNLFKPTQVTSFNSSSLLSNPNNSKKVISYFPADRRNFIVVDLFKSKRDGLKTATFE